MTTSVVSVSSETAEAWDDFVRSCEGWTPYHLYGWRSVVEDVYSHECLYLAVKTSDGRLKGVLPLVRVRSLLFGHYLVSMPFLNYGGPLGDDESVQALASEAVRMGTESGADLVELRSPVELPLGLPVSHRKITVVLDLTPGDSEQLWKSLKAKVRSQVRRPMKEGVEVRFGPTELDAFYFVFSRHMRDLGTPVQPKALFQRALEEFGDCLWFGCAYFGNQPVAAGCGFRWANRFELVWASSLREHNRTAPNMLLYWRFMEQGAEDGAEVFDFGRCTPGSGTHRFKGQWGGRDEALWWYQSSTDGSTPSPEAGAYALGAKVWSHLPLPLANVLGPRIVRFIP